jgi:hypothetical protein
VAVTRAKRRLYVVGDRVRWMNASALVGELDGLPPGAALDTTATVPLSAADTANGPGPAAPRLLPSRLARRSGSALAAPGGRRGRR